MHATAQIKATVFAVYIDAEWLHSVYCTASEASLEADRVDGKVYKWEMTRRELENLVDGEINESTFDSIIKGEYFGHISGA